ncbi:O-succinylbenzoate synthase [Cutibacterium sp. WCA-380-WT-3A]|uniref:o-succinylbenzoate synthase n=1 Tax=Cutibacterium porci TaxID=2605781 RepID=A0A7K0J714_9ACTN|nr:o-succinylbenzoate synthase [Cutibacterium porci]MSS45744.1 O-succinylbenzoate synthase [Cutibacterium porci]
MNGLRAYRLDVPRLLADRGIDQIVAFTVPLTVRFRGIEVREGTLLHGPEGWGEWSPFWDYDPVESAAWLRAGIEGATQRLPAPRRDRVPINVTIPVVDTDRARTMAAESACKTAKVKVADPRSDLREDCQRVAAVREAMPDGAIRVDANAAWDVSTAVRAITELDAAAEGLEYVEQPCASVAELAQVRRKVTVPVAADESVRRAEDPLAVARAGAADLLVIKAQPLAGLSRALEVIDAAGLPVVVSSALDTSVGIGLATHLAAALPALDHACGLGTIRLFHGDVSASPLLPVDGYLVPRRGEVDVEIEEPDADLCPRWAQRLGLTVAALVERS